MSAIDSGRSKEDPIGDLVAAFPRLFHGAHPAAHSWVPPGWRPLAHQLFTDIDALLTNEEARGFAVRQVKEKYAELRVYFWLQDERTNVLDAVTPAGVAKISSRPVEASSAFLGVQRLVRDAGIKSMSICMTCGAPARMCDDGGWLRTACGEHWPQGATVVEPEIR